MQLTSVHFADQAAIPAQHTCKGQNTSPSLAITGVPAKAVSLALILHDPDAVHGDFTHWMVWNIHPDTMAIAENSVPDGAMQGINGRGVAGYMGPCPPAGTGTHHYIFELYALNDMLDVPQNADRATVEAAIAQHTIAKAQLVGLFGE